MLGIPGMAECMLRVGLGGYGIAECPQRHRLIRLYCRSYVSTKTCRKWTVFGRLVECNRTIKMSSALCKVSGMQQRKPGAAMRYHERDDRSLLLGEC